MPNCVFVSPAVEAVLERVAVCSHLVHLRADRVFLVLRDPIRAVIDVEARLDLVHRHRQQPVMLLLVSLAREKE